MAYGLQYDPNGDQMNVGPAGQLRDDLNQTLRSVRDTLSQSFSTLNLTMSSIHNTLRTMNANFSPRANFQPHPNYVPSFGAMPSTGALSQPMAQHLASTSMWGLTTGEKPFNVPGYEYAWQRNLEMNHRLNQFGVDTALGVPHLAAGAMAGWGLQRWASNKPGMLGQMGRARMPLIGGPIAAAGMAIAGTVLDPVVGAYSDAANVYGRDIAGIRRMSTRFGNEFTNHQSGIVAKGITNYANRELVSSTDFDTRLGTDGMRNVLMQGLQMNMFQGRKPEELVKQMESAASVVKFLTQVLGSKDVQETMRAVGNMKTMGVNAFQNQGFVRKLGVDSYKYGQMMSVPGSQLLQQAAMMGTQAYGAYGMPSFGGIAPAMQNMALANELEKRRALSTAEIAAAGGHSAMAGRQVQFTAGMMNHGALGQMMLASGWQGGGNFSMGKFNKSIAGGYWNNMNSALGSIAGDPKKYAEFMMNQENLYAGAAAQGGLDDNVKKVLFSALDNMHGMDDENSAGVIIKQIASTMGIQLSNADAKMISMQRSRPGSFKAMNSEADRHRDRGFYHENALRYNRFRSIGEAGEYVDKILARLKNMFGTEPAQWMHDKISDLMGEPDTYKNGPSLGAGEFTSNALDNLHYNLAMGPSPNALRGVDDKSFKEAYGMADRESMLGGKTGMFGSWRIGASNSAFNMTPAIEAISARQHKSYFDAMQDPNSQTGLEAFTKNRQYLHFGSYRDALMNHKNSDKYFGKMAGGVHWAADQMTDGDLSNLTGNTTGSQWYNDMSRTDAWNIASQAGIDIDAYGSNDKDALMQRLIDENNPVLAQYAKARGVSVRNMAYGMVSKYHGGDSGMSNYFRLMGAHDNKWKDINELGAAADKANGNTFGVDRWALQASNGITLGTNQLQDSLKTIGLDFEDIRSINNDKDGAQELQKFGGLVSKLQQGKELSAFDLGQINSPILKQRLNDLAQKKPNEITAAVQGDSWLGYGNKAKNSDGSEMTFEQKLSQLLQVSGSNATTEQVTKGINDVWGFQGVTSSQVQQLMQNGDIDKFSEFVESREGGGKQGIELQDKLRGIRNGDISSLREQYASILGDNVSDDKVKDTIRRSLLDTSLSKATSDANARPEKGSLGYVTEDYNGTGALRVVMVDDKIKAAELKARGQDVAAKNGAAIQQGGARSGGAPTNNATSPTNSNASAATGGSWWNEHTPSWMHV